MQPSLARIVLAAFFAVAGFVALAGLVLHQMALERERSLQHQPPPYAGFLLASQISATVRDWSRGASAVAHSPLTARFLQSPDEATRKDILNTLLSLQPELGNLQIISLAQAQGSAPIPALLSPRQKQLLNSARSTEAQTILRVETLSLNLSEPVRAADGSLLGFVLAERDLLPIRDLFAQSPLIDGYAELQQVNGNADVLLKRGNEQLKVRLANETVSISGTPWRLALWQNPTPGIFMQYMTQMYAGIGATVIILIGLVCLVGYRLSNRTLQADMTALTKLFSDITHGRVRKRYDIQLKELRNGYQVMYQLAKMMVGKHLQAINTAGTDHLSQVNNRRSFEAKQREVFSRVREGWAHSLLILDIDNFKRVNDSSGHDAGDQLIIQFGKALKDNLRASDFVARLGGDEFCVIFPNTPLKKAIELSDRLRQNLPRSLELLPGVMHTVSWSGGLSEYSRDDQSENAALSRADQALLDAKRAGRNRTQTKAAA